MNILRDSIVVTRKRHQCSACGRYFDAGTKMRTQVNTSDGIITWRECPTCHTLIKEFPKKFFDDAEEVFPSYCVHEILKQGQTPEQLLEECRKQERDKLSQIIINNTKSW